MVFGACKASGTILTCRHLLLSQCNIKLITVELNRTLSTTTMKATDSVQRTQVTLEQAPQKRQTFSIKNIFKTDQAIGVSIFRLYLMRFLFLLNFVLLGLSVWPGLINHGKPWDPMHGIAISFWAALSLLSGLGIRYPLKMLPLLIMQFVYKSIWVLAVGLTLRSAGQLSPIASELFSVCSKGLVVDLLVIPWSFVLANYIKAPGDRWR